MNVYKLLQMKCIYYSTALLSILSAQGSANSACIEIADTYTAMIGQANYLNVHRDDTIIKKGPGKLSITESQGAINDSAFAISGTIHLQEGAIEVSKTDALGNGKYWNGSALATADTNKLIMDDDTTLVFSNALVDANLISAPLTVPLAINTADRSTEVNIDISGFNNSLTSISAVGEHPMVVNINSTGRAAEFELKGRFTHGSAEDTITLGEGLTFKVDEGVESTFTINQLRILNGGRLYYNGYELGNGFRLNTLNLAYQTLYETSDTRLVYGNPDWIYNPNNTIITFYPEGSGTGSPYKMKFPRVSPKVNFRNGSTLKVAADLTLPVLSVDSHNNSSPL